MRLMKKAFFRPYIGKGFENPSNNIFGGLKILVLGHNHYCNTLFNIRKDNKVARCGYLCPGYAEKCNDFTNNIVEQFMSYCQGNTGFDWFMNTYSKFANALSGYNYSPQDVWNNIAFFNYCQSAVSFDAEQPETMVYDESKEDFLNFLINCKPDIILCWGYEKVYMNTPSDNWTAPNGGQLGFYTIGDKKIPMFHILHPSYKGFRTKVEYEKIDEYLSRIKKEKNLD